MLPCPVLGSIAAWAQVDGVSGMSDNTKSATDEIDSDISLPDGFTSLSSAAMSWQLPSKKAAHLRHLLDAAEVPNTHKTPFILSGYRPWKQEDGLCSLCGTVFTLHNETGNMWTHLVGFGYFVFLACQLVAELTGAEEGQNELLWLLLLVFASSFTLFWSFLYHLCLCTTTCVRDCTYKMDLSGIIALIVTSYFTGIALGYRCFPSLRRFYLVYAACISLLLAGPLVWPSLISNVTRHLICCVAVGLLPALHFCYISPSEDVALVVPYLLAMFGCYGFGAIFYLTRWPERRWPGRFDLFLHSHQLWHVFVLFAAASWVRGCHVFLQYFNALHCEELQQTAELATQK